MTLRKHPLSFLLVALVVAAIAAPIASARPIDEVGYNPQPTGRSDTPSTVRVVQASSDDGFSWGDAGIGAGAAFALTMIGLGTVLVVGSRRHRQAPERATA